MHARFGSKNVTNTGLLCKLPRRPPRPPVPPRLRRQTVVTDHYIPFGYPPRVSAMLACADVRSTIARVEHAICLVAPPPHTHTHTRYTSYTLSCARKFFTHTCSLIWANPTNLPPSAARHNNGGSERRASTSSGKQTASEKIPPPQNPQNVNVTPPAMH